MGNLPRIGADYEGIHARGNNDRSEMAGGIRARILQIQRPNEAQQVQEESTIRAAVQ